MNELTRLEKIRGSYSPGGWRKLFLWATLTYPDFAQLGNKALA
jgi:hypothetical protein